MERRPQAEPQAREEAAQRAPHCLACPPGERPFAVTSPTTAPFATPHARHSVAAERQWGAQAPGLPASLACVLPLSLSDGRVRGLHKFVTRAPSLLSPRPNLSVRRRDASCYPPGPGGECKRVGTRSRRRGSMRQRSCVMASMWAGCSRHVWAAPGAGARPPGGCGAYTSGIACCVCCACGTLARLVLRATFLPGVLPARGRVLGLRSPGAIQCGAVRAGRGAPSAGLWVERHKECIGVHLARPCGLGHQGRDSRPGLGARQGGWRPVGLRGRQRRGRGRRG